MHSGLDMAAPPPPPPAPPPPKSVLPALNKSPARMQAANMRPKGPFRDQLEDAVRLKFGGSDELVRDSYETLGGWIFCGTQLEDCQLQDGPQ